MGAERFVTPQPLRRFSSRSTASLMKSERFSPSFSTASILASVPPGKRAGVCSSLIRGRPTTARISEMTFCVEPCILLISPIDVSGITYYRYMISDTEASEMVIKVREMTLRELVALCNNTARSPEARYAAQSELLARKLRVLA